GFNTIRTEWWHFAYNEYWKYPIQNQPLPCD
ncbi:MAG: peptidase M15, partial [Flavobacteriaceae bacterium]|nr:peptidase M15 [Flavobacteriaceae bacterium]